MKWRILALLVALAMVVMVLVVPPAVFAAEATVTCTVSATPTLVSLTVSDGDVAYGTLALGATESTIALNDTQIVTNNGTVTEDFNIKSSDATRGGGTTWELVTGTPGLDEFEHEFANDGGYNWTAMPANNDFTAMNSGVMAGYYFILDLQITMPSSTTDPLEHSITVTVMAVEHT